MPICAPGMPGMSKVGMLLEPRSITSISTSLSASEPFAQETPEFFARLLALALPPTSASITRSSALSSAWAPTSLARRSLRHGQRHLNQVANDRFHIPADIADLGELGRLDLDERRLRQFGQTACDLGLTTAGGADGQNVLRLHLFTKRVLKLLATPAIAKSDRHGAFGVFLTDDEAVEFRDDFARGECGHDRVSLSRGR